MDEVEAGRFRKVRNFEAELALVVESRGLNLRDRLHVLHEVVDRIYRYFKQLIRGSSMFSK